MMNFYVKTLFFNLFTLYFISIDKDFSKCKNKLGKLLIVAHHYLASVIIFSGILYGYYLFNLLLLIAILIGWIFLGSRCKLTLITNNICNFNKNNTFKNFATHFIKINKKYKNYIPVNMHYLTLFFLIILNIVMVIINRNN